jgi:glyoxylase-like metal-dependent hydrolase (beta-lactamase superfamily II)
MRLPGPFHVRKIVDLEWCIGEPGLLLRDVTTAEFLATRTARDARFVEQATGRPILSFHSYLVDTPGGRLLVDSCVGDHKERPLIPQWHRRQGRYLERLREAGVDPGDIAFVCCTHLHADHIGWNTRLANGRWVPTFPNARYLFAEAEVAYWEGFHRANPGNIYEKAWEDSILPVMEQGLVDRVRGDHEIARGVRLRAAPGHTPGNVVIELAEGGERAILSGDVIHHPAQIERASWCSQFCLDPDTARRTRVALLADLADTATILLAAHFAGPTAVRVQSAPDGFFYGTL